VLLMSVGPGTINWKRAVDVMAEKRGDRVIVSLLHRFCLKPQNQNQQLGLIALYTLSSFYIDAPKRLLRNFIEEGGAALLAGTVKNLTEDSAAPDHGFAVAAIDVFKIVWGLVVNVTCSPNFGDILSSPSSDSIGGRGFHVVDSTSDSSETLVKQRFTNQELLPVRSPVVRIPLVS
jgi:hypothetical protein